MINRVVLYLPHTDCHNERLKPYAKELGVSVNLNPDRHIGEPLSKIFSQIIRFDVGESYADNGIVQTNRKIINLVKEHSPKYVIWPTMTYEVLEETFQEIRELGAYVVGWFFDDETRFDSYSMGWIPYMDYIFTADKFSVQRYQQLGAKAYHVLVTCEPEHFMISSTNTDYEIAVSFVGSKSVADRADWVKKLIGDGISTETFGKGWDNGFVSHDEMVKIFTTSKINICFTKAYSGTRNQLKGKIFDITTCGGFLLCEYVDGIEDIFEIGKEIVCFNNYTEAIEKINYFLIHKEEREQIAKAGKVRVTSELSQHILLEKAFTAIEIDIANNSERTLNSVSFPQMARPIRMAHAQYHIKWAEILKKTGFEKSFWKDELNISQKYVSYFIWMYLRHRNFAHIIPLIRKLRRKIKDLSKKTQASEIFANLKQRLKGVDR